VAQADELHVSAGKDGTVGTGNTPVWRSYFSPTVLASLQVGPAPSHVCARSA
jgi:hypothetical protein